MINVKYEIYWNDYNRRYVDKSFQDLQAFKDWMFGLMNRPYVDSDGYKNMHFLDYALNSQRKIDSSSRIDIRPERGGAAYWIYCVSDNNKVVYSNGKYTNGQCYISEGFKDFLRGCMDLRDGKVQTFEFGEIDGYRKNVADLSAMSPKEENIVNIALMAASLLKDGKIDVEEHGGHAALTSEIVWMAGEFERRFSKVDWSQSKLTYWEEIDRFAEERLLEMYGVEKSHVADILVSAQERAGGSSTGKNEKDFLIE